MIGRIKKMYYLAGAYAMVAMESAMANDLTASANKVGGGMQAVLTVLPVGAQILGFIIAGGGLFQIQKYHKSQGRDGSMGGGIAGIVIGVCLFALGGFLKWTGGSIGVDASSTSLPGGVGGGGY